MTVGGFDAQDEQIAASLGTPQPFRFTPGLLLGPEPGYTQTITCRCQLSAVSPYTGRDTVVPCVETAGDNGLCPACAAGLCVKANEATGEAA